MPQALRRTTAYDKLATWDKKVAGLVD